AAVAIDGIPRPRVRVLGTAHRDFAPDLRERTLRAASGEQMGTLELASLHAALGDAYADAADAFLPSLEVRPDLIAVHGQTVAHLPRQATLQLGDASRVAVRTGVITIADFRSADIAAGGEGAPLVSFADHVLFADRAPLALLNLGGIANLTLLPTASADDVVAFDTGPANMVSDGGAQRDSCRAPLADHRADSPAHNRRARHPHVRARGDRVRHPRGVPAARSAEHAAARDRRDASRLRRRDPPSLMPGAVVVGIDA